MAKIVIKWFLSLIRTPNCVHKFPSSNKALALASSPRVFFFPTYIASPSEWAPCALLQMGNTQSPLAHKSLKCNKPAKSISTGHFGYLSHFWFIEILFFFFGPCYFVFPSCILFVIAVVWNGLLN